MNCPKGQIEKSGYTRKEYRRKDGTLVKRTSVGATCIEDKGKKGKGPKILPTPDPNISLRKYGYSTKKSENQRHRSLKRASKETGTLPVLRRLNLIANFNKWNPEVEHEMREDVEYLKNEYIKEKSRNMKRNSKSKVNSKSKKVNKQKK